MVMPSPLRPGGDAGIPHTAFVPGDGGLLGACEVGILAALSGAGIRPDLVLSMSVGAINGAFIAADPDSAKRLDAMWGSGADRRWLLLRTIIRLALSHGPAPLEGIASGTSNAVRQLGTVLAIAVLGTIQVALRRPAGQPQSRIPPR
jgi:predicted acylesterase/phospholipase RssA